MHKSVKIKNSQEIAEAFKDLMTRRANVLIPNILGRKKSHNQTIANSVKNKANESEAVNSTSTEQGKDNVDESTANQS